MSTTSMHRVCTQQSLALPAEILLEILDHIQAADDMGHSERHQVLSNLARVSRYFYIISAPRIFRSLRFDVAQCDPRAPSWIEFCTQLISEQYSPPWMTHVKECSFVGWHFLRPRSSDFTGLYAHAVTKFTHLNSISFKSCPMNGTFFDAMLSLKNLKSIAIVNCYFEVDMTTSHISNLSHLHLAAFELSGNVEACYIEALADLISTSSLRFLRTNNYTLTQAVINHPVDFLIDQFHVCLHLRDVSIFGEFLNRTPSITHLSISITPDWKRPFRELSTSFFGLSSSSLPRLSAVTCPPVFISEFISGRSVSQIDLSDSDHVRYSRYPAEPPEDVSIDLSLLDVTMSTTELHIWLESYLRNDLKAIFPKLDSLRLFCRPSDFRPTIIYNIRKRWPEPLMIRYLWIECTASHLDLKMQHEFTIISSIYFPNLMRIRMSQEIEWRRANEQYNHWEPFVLPEYRDYVKLRIKSTYKKPGTYYADVTDFNGCYAALFKPCEVDDSLRSKLELIKVHYIRA